MAITRPAGTTPEPVTPLTREQLTRYSRQIILDEVGVEGQRKLLRSRVLCVGAGGLGAPVAIYLAAAGVGTIGVVDADRVDLSNLHRQVLHFERDRGRPKTESARQHLEALNPDVRVNEHRTYLSSENALEILAGYDLVINGCDNFATRYLVNDACVLLKKPLVDASILRFEGQATVFLPGQGCYRCLYPDPPPPGEVPSCAEGGILGALAGHMGTLQAIEALKVLLGIGKPLTSRLILYDALAGEYRHVRWRRDPDCPICGDHPTITALIDYEEFCGVPAPGSEVPADVLVARNGWEIHAAEAAAALRSPGVQWIDVRQPEEYRAVRIPGTRLLPMDEVEGRLAEIDREKDVYVVCRSGRRSAEVTRLLRERGYGKAFNLAGGMLAWLNEHLPTEGDGR